MNKQQPSNEVQNETSTKNKFRNTNASDFITNGEAYQVFPDGILVSKTKLVTGIKMEHRQKALYSIGLNTLALNPDLTEDEIFNSLCSINKNKKQINIPLPYSELKKITAMILKKRDGEGELKPDFNHTRKIIFDTVNYPMTKQQIRQIVGKETGILKMAKTKQAIYDIIEGWDKNFIITIKMLSILLGKGFSERTIKKYWPAFKGYVKEINTTIRAKNKSSVEMVGLCPDLDPVQFHPSEKLYNNINDFSTLVKQYNPTFSIAAIKRYYDDLTALGIEKTETNIQSIVMYKQNIPM